MGTGQTPWKRGGENVTIKRGCFCLAKVNKFWSQQQKKHLTGSFCEVLKIYLLCNKNYNGVFLGHVLNLVAWLCVNNLNHIVITRCKILDMYEGTHLHQKQEFCKGL